MEPKSPSFATTAILEEVPQIATPAKATLIPDPIITANIYCSRYIDDLLRDAVAPYRLAMRDDTNDDSFLWFFRYGKRGEHLKLRVHAPEARRELLRANLERTISRFLESIADAPLPAKRISKSALPPVDAEDALDDDYPDRSLLWTTYRRSPVIVGDPIYAQDDRHMALFTRALAASADFLLAEILPASREPRYLQHRQNSFLKLIIAGIASTGLEATRWSVYFRYHHDWLIRHLLSQVSLGVDAAALDAELTGHVDKVRGAVPALARIMIAHQAEEYDRNARSGPLGTWRAAVHEFFSFIQCYRGRPEYDRDPYTDDHSFLPLFKVLHACANQLGFRISNEAFLYRLLIEAAADSEVAP
jgi:hypothetical protein